MSRSLTNQNHGIVIETLIRSTFGFEPRHINDIYDIPAEFNSEFGIDISVKTTCTDFVCLADARRFRKNTDPLQFIVLRYASVGEKKVIFEVNTYLIASDRWEELWGGLPYSKVEMFHDGLRSFGLGNHAAARQFAKLQKAMLEEQYGSLKLVLNPKVDSKNQRRLQCSVHLKDLKPFLIDSETVNYRGIKLPRLVDMEGDVIKKQAA